MSSFKDLVKKANAGKQTTKKKEEDKNHSSFVDLVKKTNANIKSNLTEDEVSKWSNSVGDIGKRAYNYLATDGYKKADTALAEEINKHIEDSHSISQYLRANKSRFKNYDEIYNGYIEQVNYLKDLQKSITDSNEYFSKFKTEKEYEDHKIGWLNPEAETNAETASARQERYRQNEARLKQMKEDLPWYAATIMPDFMENWFLSDEDENKKVEYETLKAENNQYKRTQSVLDEYYTPETPEFLANGAERNYSNASKEDLQKHNVAQTRIESLLADGNHYYDSNANIVNATTKKIDYVADDLTRAMYAEATGSPTSGGFFDTDKSDNATEQYYNSLVQDKLGMFLSASDDDVATAYSELASAPTDVKNTWARILQEGDQNAWKYLEEHELNIYYNLYKTQGQTAAYEYLDKMTTELTRRETVARQKEIDEASWLEQIWLNLKSVPQNIFGGALSFVEDTANIVRGEDINPYSRAHSFQNDAQYVRQVTAQEIDEATGGMAIPWLDFSFGDAYQALMSAADSTVGVMMGGTTYGTFMGMGAASSTMKDLWEKGADAGQMFAGGILSGAAEMIFEKYSIDKLVKIGDAKTISQVIFSGLKQGGIEASEEMLTEIANTVTNSIVMGSQSDWVDAETFAKNVVKAGLSGFISGKVMGGVTSAINYNVNKSKFKQAGADIIEQGATEELLNLANEMAGVTGDKTLFKYSDKAAVANQNKAGSKKAALEVGRTSALLQDNITEQNQGDIQDALIEKGLDKKDAKRVSEYLASTKELTEEQIAEVKGNENIKAVAKELLGDPESKINERQKKYIAAKLGVRYEAPNLSDTATDSGDIAVNTEVDVKDKVSADGKTVQVSTGEAITINKDNAIAKTKIVDGERVVYFNTDKGMVSSKDVSYASESEALVYESFVDLNPAFANAVIKNYDGKVPVQTYIKGMREGIILYGMHNFQGVGKDISKNTYFAELSAEDQAFALKLGSAYADMVAKKQGETLRTAIKNAAEKAETNEDTSTKATHKKGKVSFEDGVKPQGKLQKRTVNLAKHLARAMGIDIVFYDARTSTDPNGQGSNGYFNEDTNTIHLDLQNAQNDAKTIAFTLSHELVHFIKKWSPEKFNTFSKFLMENYAKHGVNTSQLLANKMADLGTKDADLAYEEMIADACETMLLDSNAVYKLMELRKADLELFEKIKLHIHELLNKLRNMYKELGLQPTSDEAKALLGMTDVLEQMYSLFEEASVDAVQTYQAVQKANETIFGEESVDVGKTESGIKNQLKNHKKIGEDATAYNNRHKKVHKAILQVGIESMYEKAEARYKKQAKKSSMSNSVFTEEEMLNIRKNVVNHFNLKGINGFEQVQKGVLNTLRANGFFDNNGEKKVIVKENGMEVTINYGSIKETFGKGNKYESIPATFKILKLATIEQIPNIIESANVIAENEENKHNNGKNKTFTYLRGTATIEGKYVPVRITLKISKEKNKFWVHHIDVTKNADDIFRLGAENASPTNSKLSSAEDIISQEGAESQDKTVKKQVKKSPSSYAPTFYSQMGKVIEGIKMEKIGAASVVNFLKGKGIKHDEIKWSGIETFLEGKKSVTKAELQEFIAGSQLQIEENVRDDRRNGIKVKRVSKNVAEAYVNDELISTFTKKENGWWQSDKDSYLSAGSFHDIKRAATTLLETDTKWSEYTLEGGKNYREITFKMPTSTYSNGAMRGHWGDNAKGIIAHARIQDFKVDGKKMLFIEEIQSDWHNEGHKRGYINNNDASEIAELEKRVDELFFKIEDYSTEVTGLAGEWETIEKTTEGARLIQEYNKAVEELESVEKQGFRKVPDAPFKDNYHEYVIKSLLRTAAENGYDSIGWTPADVQSERWSDEFAEGYRIEYDQDMPKFLKKYGKQWGATVGSTVLNNGTEVWSMEITEPMEQAVLYEGQAKFQKKKVSNRTILSNALESAIDTSTQAGQNELKWLKEYQSKINTIEKEEAHLAEVNAEIKEISFGKNTDRSKLKDLNEDKVRTNNRINTYDKQLMRIEAMKPIKDILAREKEIVRKRTEEKGREALAEYRKEALKVQKQMIGEARKETRQKISESRSRTEMKAKIQKVVSELNQLLLNGTKDKHVTEGLQKAVAMALDSFNMDTVGADKRVAKYNALIAKATDPDVIASLTETRDRIQKQGDRMSDKLTKLKDAYNDIINSSDPNTANVYDKVIANYIESALDKVGNTSLRDMSIDQLDTVYSVYKMVLTTVRNFNKAFKMAKAESISSLGNKVMMEVEKVGGSKTHVLGGKLGSALSLVKKFDFNNLKPVYAFEKIGSSTLSQIFENVRKGEDVWAVDITEAKDFKEETAKKYNYKKWDFDKVYTFKTSTGTEFSLSLDQMMSLYAYSKREQALPHLAEGGFVFDENIETYKVKENGKKSVLKYKVNTATAHKVSPFEVADIVGKLTADQKAFVDEMQKYLSDVMGAKGNEVALEMYGVKLFKEKHYFPLKSAKQYMFEQNEVAGEVKIKNSGFSQGTVKHANNPVILSDFMDVWANHVNDMSMYHAFVLPLEDFNRVFNYNTPASQSLEEESVKGFIQNAYGRHANEYISQLIKDLNGGARVDPRETVSKNMIGKFKKASVFGSASVVIQQPSAIGRALALIGARYFDFNPKLINHNKLWTEVKKYAPVAIIKEMGHFDTDMGASTVDYIKGESTFMEKVDDVISKPASFMDELTWVHIWTAVKREVKANNKDLSGEAYLQKCGERFTEVVTKTQVYDSVLSRSANMRSKSVFMNMLTSFMAEPTTSINMLEDALTKISRGQKGKASRQIASVAASVILNSMLVAFVYAARDDDEDETYWEKYIGSLTAEVIDGSNPITYYPILKDIWSIAQGFDVERSDMTLISKAVDSLKNVVTTMMTDTEDMTEEELSEHNKQIVDSWLGVAGEFSSLFGIPAKNLIRDIKAGFNVYNTVNNGAEGSWSLLWDAVAESAVGAVPIVGWFAKESKSDKLYNVIVAGDTASINRMKSGYKDDKAYNTAVRKALRENDPRIKEAAEARFNGDMTLYKDIAYQIKGEGNFTQDDIVAAIMTEYNTLKSANKEESSSSKSPDMYNYSDYYNAITNGDANDIAVVKDYLLEDGKTEKNIASNFNSNVKEAYEKGEISDSEAKSLMVSYGGKDEDEADISIRYVDFKTDYPEYKDTITESRFANYYEPMEDYYGRSVATTGLSFSYYSEYCVQSAECTGIDADGDGRADSGTKKAEVMKVINSLPITIAQKDALYFLNGWSKKNLFEDAPWR